MDGQVKHIDDATNVPDAIPEDGHGPIPPRYWWMKRVSIGVGVLLVVVVVLRLLWGLEADRRLQAEIDRIIAAGEPFYPEDYIEDVADEQNAAVLYEKAAGAVRTDPNSEINISFYCLDREGCEDHLDDARALIELNAPVIDFVRRGRALPQVSWKNPGVTQAQLAAATFSGDQQVARVLRIAAYVHFLDCNHQAFVEALLDMIAHGEAQAHRPIRIANRLAWACVVRAFRMIGEFSRELVVDQEAVSNEIRPVNRSTVEFLISVLLDEENLVGAYYATRNGERTLAYNMHAEVLNSAAGPKSSWAELVFNFPFRVYEAPLVKLDLARSLSTDPDLIPLAEETWLATQARPKGVPASVGLVRILARPISESRIPQESINRSIFNFYKSIMLRRLNAIGLAIRLFELDHGGRPESLELLVPDYLPSIPIGSLASDGAEIAFIRESDRDRLFAGGLSGHGDDRARIAVEYLLDRQPAFTFYLDANSESPLIAQEIAPPSSGQTIENGQRGKNARGHTQDQDRSKNQPQDRK